MHKDDWALLLVGCLCLIPVMDFVIPVLSPLWKEGSVVRPLTLDDTEGCEEKEQHAWGMFKIFEFCVLDADKEVELNESECANNSYDQCGRGSCQ